MCIHMSKINMKYDYKDTVAQVYKARLRPQYALEGGEQNVAVKIRHPKILDESFMDIEIIFTPRVLMLPKPFPRLKNRY